MRAVPDKEDARAKDTGCVLCDLDFKRERAGKRSHLKTPFIHPLTFQAVECTRP
jgi:hypothetical protein